MTKYWAFCLLLLAPIPKAHSQSKEQLYEDSFDAKDSYRRKRELDRKFADKRPNKRQVEIAEEKEIIQTAKFLNACEKKKRRKRIAQLASLEEDLEITDNEPSEEDVVEPKRKKEYQCQRVHRQVTERHQFNTFGSY